MNDLFNNYTAGVVAYVLAAGVLVTILLVGGFLILNLGLMSKRREDRIGHRDPSDVGILKHTMFPEEPEDRRFLPADDEGEPELQSKQPASRADVPSPEQSSASKDQAA